jgi:hypothetical protein
MAWVKLDDAFYDHPRLLDRSLADLGLWAVGIAYSNRHMQDGFVPAAFVKRMGGKPAGLVSCGAWEPCDGGWRIRDYLQHQRSAEEIRELREKRAAAGSKGGSKRQANASASDEQGAQAEEKRREETEAAGAKRLSASERRALIARTVDEVAQRRNLRSHADGKNDPDRWYQGALRGIESELRDWLNALITENPNARPSELADILEPNRQLRVVTTCSECMSHYTRKDGKCNVGGSWAERCPMGREGVA